MSIEEQFSVFIEGLTIPPTNMKVADLERGGCLRVLFLLKDLNTMTARELGEHINYQTFQRARTVLKELGLLEVEENGSRRLLHRLTQKGLDVAFRVGEIEELL